jgi:hypothetical protein
MIACASIGPTRETLLSEQPRPAATALDAIIPTNPLAAVSCWVGIFSLLICMLGVVLGPIAVVTGWLALKKWKMQESVYGAKASTVRAWIGIVTGGLGTLLGIAMVVLLVFRH